MRQPVIPKVQAEMRGLRQLAPLTPVRKPPWKLIIPLLILAVLIPGAILLAQYHAGTIREFHTPNHTSAPPTDPEVLAGGHLAGERSPFPLAVVLILDDSGSFSSYAEMRRMALDQIVEWVPNNLRPDDTITVITFANSAYLTLPTTTVADLAAKGPAYASGNAGGGTQIQPALQLAASAVPDGMTSTLIFVTDTEISDGGNTSRIQDYVKQMNATTMSVILPENIRIQSNWGTAFSWEIELHANPKDADDVALAVGQALAHGTGQRLEK